jgi:hypothetical protein
VVSSEEFRQDEEETLVVFRKWRGEGGVVALFPEVKERSFACASYMHHGGHGAARYGAVVNATTPATPEEYAALKAELEGPPYGYRLKVRRRWLRG